MMLVLVVILMSVLLVGHRATAQDATSEAASSYVSTSNYVYGISVSSLDHVDFRNLRFSICPAMLLTAVSLSTMASIGTIIKAAMKRSVSRV